ncbi:hypothetical protein C8R47DRAFT_1277101 [Mycena vitilis]|nr:hypothetical protein C8R47DRAFT_1277101 [Mycena vitilis]
MEVEGATVLIAVRHQWQQHRGTATFHASLAFALIGPWSSLPSDNPMELQSAPGVASSCFLGLSPSLPPIATQDIASTGELGTWPPISAMCRYIFWVLTRRMNSAVWADNTLMIRASSLFFQRALSQVDEQGRDYIVQGHRSKSTRVSGATPRSTTASSAQTGTGTVSHYKQHESWRWGSSSPCVLVPHALYARAFHFFRSVHRVLVGEGVRGSGAGKRNTCVCCADDECAWRGVVEEGEGDTSALMSTCVMRAALLPLRCVTWRTNRWCARTSSRAPMFSVRPQRAHEIDRNVYHLCGPPRPIVSLWPFRSQSACLSGHVECPAGVAVRLRTRAKMPWGIEGQYTDAHFLRMPHKSVPGKLDSDGSPFLSFRLCPALGMSDCSPRCTKRRRIGNAIRVTRLGLLVWRWKRREETCDVRMRSGIMPADRRASIRKTRIYAPSLFRWFECLAWLRKSRKKGGNFPGIILRFGTSTIADAELEVAQPVQSSRFVRSGVLKASRCTTMVARKSSIPADEGKKASKSSAPEPQTGQRICTALKRTVEQT